MWGRPIWAHVSWWAPPAGRRYSVIRPIDSTRAQKRRKCGAAVFGALFLTHPPSPPSNRCLLKWTLKTYLIIWVTPVLTLPANDCFARKINRRCVSKPFLLDEFSFSKDVISKCFKSWRWPTVCSEEVAWKSDNIVNRMIASFGKKSEWGFFKYCLYMNYMINLKWFIVTSLPLGQ